MIGGWAVKNQSTIARIETCDRLMSRLLSWNTYLPQYGSAPPPRPPCAAGAATEGKPPCGAGAATEGKPPCATGVTGALPGPCAPPAPRSPAALAAACSSRPL